MKGKLIKEKHDLSRIQEGNSSFVKKTFDSDIIYQKN